MSPPRPDVRGRTGDRAKTAENLRLAILRVKNAGRRVSIKSVAEEAGVDASLVHHVYPDIAEEIRAISGRSTRTERDKVRQQLAAAKAHIRTLEAEVEKLLAEVAQIASVNLTLAQEAAQLQAALRDNVRALQKV
jgi:AcrR family transcriptional regulator